MSDSLGDRMKMYERLADNQLVPKMPVMGRLDGKAFHTYTRSMRRPWDHRLVEAMQAAAVHLCENIQGCRMAFVQSDEITLLLTDWDRYGTQSWFDYRVQKMCSIAASMCSVAFHEAVRREFGEEAPKALPMFDARFWNLPRHEVVNAIVWRQQDATRNSIQMLARAHFSHSQCHRKNTSQLQDMLHAEHGINWNDTPTHLKRGACIVKEELEGGRTGWVVDKEIPIFTQDRDYIGKHLTEVFWKEEE